MNRVVKVCQDWNDDYLVGDLLIDGEHKKIIELACSFARLVESGAVSYRVALELVKEVASHISAHFSHEELLLTLYNTDIAQIELHKKEHTKFKVILSAAIEEVRDVGQGEEFTKACIDLTDKLYDMVTDHIATVDKDTLAPCIAAHEYPHHHY